MSSHGSLVTVYGPSMAAVWALYVRVDNPACMYRRCASVCTCWCMDFHMSSTNDILGEISRFRYSFALWSCWPLTRVGRANNLLNIGTNTKAKVVTVAVPEKPLAPGAPSPASDTISRKRGHPSQASPIAKKLFNEDNSKEKDSTDSAPAVPADA
uniref:Uncharacterized protein n=1 Tax=Oryza punctata TaxID=4537 RepID=A0A0E0JP60_ORYPU